MLGMQTNKATAKPGKITADSITSTWIDHEVGGCNFKDVRLAKRFGKLLGMMSEGIGESIPYACQDWANTKAAYRFFSNDDVSEDFRFWQAISKPPVADWQRRTKRF